MSSIFTTKVSKAYYDFLTQRKHAFDAANWNANLIGTDKISYTCQCGTPQTRSWNNILTNKDEAVNKDYKPTCCLSKKEETAVDFKFALKKDLEEFKDKDGNHWKKYCHLCWVNDKGEVLSKQGEPLQYKNGFIKLNKKAYSRAELIASVFQLEEYTKQKLIPYFDDECKEPSLKTLQFKKSASERLFATKVNKKTCNLKQVPGFTCLEICENGYVFKGNAQKSISIRDNYPRVSLQIGEKSYRLRVDILVQLAHNPLQDFTYDDYQQKALITYKDNDICNVHPSNVIVQVKEQSKTQIHNENHAAQIAHTQSKVLHYVTKIRKGKMVTDINSIKNFFDVFQYTCNCGETYERNFKQCSENGNECASCIKKSKLQAEDQNEFLHLETQEYFKRWTKGWAGNKGTILNNRKEVATYNHKDNLITIQGQSYNTKVLIAKAFDLPHSDLLEWETVQEDNFSVWFIDPTTNEYSPENLFVWSNLACKIPYLPLSKDSYQEYKQYASQRESYALYSILSNEDQTLLGKLRCHEFEGLYFYENGYIMDPASRDTFTRGFKYRNGYLYIHTRVTFRSVHRVIGFLFHPIEGFQTIDDYEDLQIDHINGNKEDNSIINLDWVSPKENMQRAKKNEQLKYAIPVLQYNKLEDGSKGEFLNKFLCIKDAVKLTGISYDAIKKSCDGFKCNIKYVFTYERLNQTDLIALKKERKNFIRKTLD